MEFFRLFETVFDHSDQSLLSSQLLLQFISCSRSPASAGFLLVETKDGRLQPCIDYRGLNEITVKYPHLYTPEKLYPCTYFSYKLSPAKQNYDINDRELLAIKAALKEWHHWLEGTRHPFTVLTDH